MAENKNSNRGVYNPNRFNYTDAKVSMKLKEKEEPDTGIFTHGEKIYNTAVSWTGFGCAAGLTIVMLVFACLKLNFVISPVWSALSIVMIVLTGGCWALTCLVSMKYHKSYSTRNVDKKWDFLHYVLPYLDFGFLMMMFFVMPMRYPVWVQMERIGLVTPMLWYILFIILIWAAVICGIVFHWIAIYGHADASADKQTNWTSIGRIYDALFMVLALWIPVCFYHILHSSFSMGGNEPLYLVIFAPITMDIACLFKYRSVKKRYWIHAYEMTAYLAFAMDMVAFATYTLWLWADKLL